MLAALVAAVPAAAGLPPTTTDATTTTLATTTAPAATTGETATAAATTTSEATTTAPAATTVPAVATAPRRYVATRATRLGAACTSTGAAAILAPGSAPLAVGTAPARLGAARYGRAVRFEAARARGASCRPGTVSIRSLSLFGGAVTARSVVARRGRGTVGGLRVSGRAVALRPGKALAVGSWGLLESGVDLGGRLAAPLALRLLRPRADLPAGTVVLVGFAGSAKRQAAHRKRRRHARQPLKVTPRLGETGYAFPVAGGASYVDTYGANRRDVSDGWHHGDDLFAPLGTPVVAVANGTLGLRGWEKLGGWRLWLTDAKGNQYYYAHLAGYSPQALRNRHVRAGEVLGFVGRTGDAFTTPPHLHFEIHPVSLLKLDYDGAVDPTSYLRKWRIVRVRHAPRPALPRRVPPGLPALEAHVVWRELLAARGLDRPARPETPRVLTARHAFPESDGSPPPATAAPLVRASATRVPVPAPLGRAPLALALGLGLALAAASTASTAFLRRRARRRAE
jgi:murein DD-endopeptidase MepM/ murein hydrolase activator NlpD